MLTNVNTKPGNIFWLRSATGIMKLRWIVFEARQISKQKGKWERARVFLFLCVCVRVCGTLSVRTHARTFVHRV